MKLLILILCTTSLIAQNEIVRNPRTSPKDVAAGATTFRSHCAPCHGIQGEGARGPNLALGVFYHGSTDAALLNTISEGVPGTEMPGLFYSPDRVWQIVAYIRSLNSSSGARPPGDPVRGQSLFHAKGCDQCHRVGGVGGRLGPDLTNIGAARSVNYLRQAIIDPNADVRQRYWTVNLTTRQGQSYTGFLMNEDTYTVQFIDMSEQLHSLNKADLEQYKVDKNSKMPSYRESLKDKEVDDLVAYLWSLRPERRNDEVR
jgi:putative heme-binding domain-containing protein